MSPLSSLSHQILFNLLDNDCECIYNLEFKRRIVSNDKVSVEYYVGDYSKDIVSYIESYIIHRSILSEYYEFLCEPIDLNKIPKWHRVSLYEGRSGSSLYTYTSNISSRFFCRQALKERNNEENNVQLLDYFDYETLIKYDIEDIEDDDVIKENKKRIREAFEKLCVRDRLVIKELVIKKNHWSKAFEVLSPYLNPRPHGIYDTKEKIIESWSNKQKQDAISLMKGRAIEKLRNNYMSIK